LPVKAKTKKNPEFQGSGVLLWLGGILEIKVIIHWQGPG
jgi:hypothetical protein